METILNKKKQFHLSDKARETVFDIIGYLFVMLFVYTAASKLIKIDTFKKVLVHYPIIGDYHLLIAYLVPIIELIVAATLIVPSTKRLGMFAALVLMIVFLSYILYMFYTNSKLPCSCGGVIAELSWKNHIWFNSMLIFLAGFAMKIYK
ncbi:MauE/DoxX family redox-associated membrane protein [Pedobacter sp.]|jgi:hypothetical protein|uniref:MauE/DoxX family redox-associated membrane protein n=1 Tax=Pedobacter sp. TaxID=1411316 RepID=UPI002C571BC0|nr:MauE/DoxX family redox-associated membrane protein [Pedobacter sp.]HWW40147.1 MauE/DoxX family redox-associated membrane protein [Pedobacter sp.]